MLLLALADIHGRVDYLPEILNSLKSVDLILIAGDITNFGGWNQAEQVLKVIDKSKQTETQILGIPGNCDSPSVSDYLTSEGMNLDGNCVNVNHIQFAGLGGSLPCPGHTLNESPDEEFLTSLASIEAEISTDKPFVLVTHQPAWGTIVDKTHDRHTGSSAILEFIIKHQPLLAVSGHIHESPGVDHIGSTTLVNPGPLCNGSYAQIEIEGNQVMTQIQNIKGSSNNCF